MHRTRLSHHWFLARFLAWFLAASLAAQGGTKPAPLTHSFTGTVTGMAADSRDPVRLTLWLEDYRRETATIVGDVRAGQDGSFAFADVPWLRAHEWGFAFFALIARQGDRIALRSLRGDDAARKPLPIALAPAVTLRGRVVDDGGRPIAGATVAARSPTDDYQGHPIQTCFFAEPPPQWRVQSAADGSFAIAGLPPGEWCVSAVHEKWVSGRVDRGSSLAPIGFVLAPAAVLTGRVLDAGRPCARMRVCAQGIRGGAWMTAFTDDAGCYRLGSLPEDHYNLWIDREDRTCAALASVDARLGEETKCDDLLAIEGGFLVGAVIDDATGKPVQPGASADVAIYGPSRPRNGGAGCDCSPVNADGTFRIRVAPGGNHIYLRQGEGWNCTKGPPDTVDVQAGGETKVEFRVRGFAAK